MGAKQAADIYNVVCLDGDDQSGAAGLHLRTIITIERGGLWVWTAVAPTSEANQYLWGRVLKC